MREAFSANGTEKQTDWNAVNWRKANRFVRNLRQRIFRAAHEGNLKKVRSLQKLMLKSYSNRLVSVRRVAQINAGKNTPGVDKLVIKTPAARGKMVDVLAHYTLWKAKPVRRVYIPKANNRRRPLGIPTIFNRAAQMLAKLNAFSQGLKRFPKADAHRFHVGVCEHGMEQQMGEVRACKRDAKPVHMSEVGLHSLARRMNLFKHHFLLRTMQRFPLSDLPLERAHLGFSIPSRMLGAQ